MHLGSLLAVSDRGWVKNQPLPKTFGLLFLHGRHLADDEAAVDRSLFSQNESACFRQLAHNCPALVRAQNTNSCSQGVGEGCIGSDHAGLNAIGQAETSFGIHDVRVTNATDFYGLFSVTRG